MKHLAAIHVVGEKAPGVYVATPCSNAFVEPKYRDGIIYTYVSHATTKSRRLELSFIHSQSKRDKRQDELANCCLLYRYDVLGPSFYALPEYLKGTTTGILLNRPTVLYSMPTRRSSRSSPGWIRFHPTLSHL